MRIYGNKISVSNEKACKISLIIKNIIQFWPSLIYAIKMREQNHLRGFTHDDPNCSDKYQTTLEVAVSYKRASS